MRCRCSFRDVVKAHDPVVTAAVAAITREAQQKALGGALYVEAAATQLAVQVRFLDVPRAE
jgi:hypothetical protein